MNETEILENQETAPAASPTVDGSTEESRSDDIVSGAPPAPMMPSPPALDTALASSCVCCYTCNPETTHRRRKNPSGTEIIYFLKTEESRCNLGIKKHRTDHKDGN